MFGDSERARPFKGAEVQARAVTSSGARQEFPGGAPPDPNPDTPHHLGGGGGKGIFQELRALFQFLRDFSVHTKSSTPYRSPLLEIPDSLASPRGARFRPGQKRGETRQCGAE